MKRTNRGRIPIAMLWTAVCLLVFFRTPLEARMVERGEAYRAAIRLLEMENSRPDQRLTPGPFSIASVEPLFHHFRSVAYLVRLSPQGFMVLSDLTEITPQVFISFDGDLETLRLHPYFGLILDRLEYNKVHLRYLAEDAAHPLDIRKSEETPDFVQVGRNERAWSEILSGEKFPAAVPDTGAAGEATEVLPLLTTKWDQDAPYWNYTPRVGSQATYTGCSATSMAQVMYYWKHPDRGQGSHSYLWNGQTLGANFDHAYNWDVMLEAYDAGYTEAQADAVARLMSDVGIAIDMNYGVTGSGGYPNDNNSFRAFFKYSAGAHDVYRADVPGWDAYFQIVREQLDVHQPVILAIYTLTSGHSVVADGYRTSPANQAHVNMGWSGAADAYYSLSNIYGYGNSAWDYAVIDIHPAQFKLTVKVTEGGTTDPAPGAYEFDYGTSRIIPVTALPSPHYRFVNWTGHASGTAAAVEIVADKEKTIKANFERIIYPPADAVGVREFNRSFSQGEYINVLTFRSHPDNVDILGYRIYRWENGQRTQIAFLAGGTGSFQYLDRGVLGDAAYTYHIVAINFDYREGDPAVIEIK